MNNFSDIDPSYSLNAGGDINMLVDATSLSQAIQNILNVVKGFRPGVSNEFYGVGVRHFLFSAMTEFVSRQIGDELLTQLEIFEPRIDVKNIFVNMDLDHKQYVIDIEYETLNQENTGDLTFRMILQVL